MTKEAKSTKTGDGEMEFNSFAQPDQELFPQSGLGQAP